MIASIAFTKFELLPFSSPIYPFTLLLINLLLSPIYPSTHLPFYFLAFPGWQKGWMSRHGHILAPYKDGLMICPESGLRYMEVSQGVLKCLDLNEEDPLPEVLKKGKKNYKDYK